MLQLKVKPKKGKATFITIESPQEGAALSRGIFKGMRCKVIYNDKPEHSSNMRTITTKMYGECTVRLGGVDKTDRYLSYINNLS